MDIALLAVSCLLVGCFTGAWLFYRGRSGTGPFPTLKRIKASEDTAKDPIKLPQVKP